MDKSSERGVISACWGARASVSVPRVRAGIYARISRDDEDTQVGVGRQLEDCESLAHARAWNIVDRYIDNSISAYKRRVIRPEYRRMLQDIREKRIDAIVVYHQDRLHRQPRELEEFFDVCDQAGLSDMATVTGDLNLADHDDRMKARILGAVARNQSDAQSRRIRRKALQLAQEGKPSGGGDRPYGFEHDRITIRDNEAEIIRGIAARFIAGESQRSIVSDLNQRGIPCIRDTGWTNQTLKRILCSARISGQREHHKQIIGPAVWDAIITPEQTARIRAIYADPSRRAVRAPRAYMLKGLLRCGKCNAIMVARPREGGARRYACTKENRGCGSMYQLADPLEDFIGEGVLERIDRPQLIAAIKGTPPAGNEWQQQSDRLAGQLDEIAEAYAAQAISMREWLAAREPIQRQLDDLTKRIVRDHNVTILAEYAGRGQQLRRDWPDLGLDRKRAIVAAMLHHIIVNPARWGSNRFQPERFEPLWRH